MGDFKTSSILLIILGVLSAIICVVSCVASAIKAIRDRRRILLKHSKAGMPADSIGEKQPFRGGVYIVHDAERKARIAASRSSRSSHGDRINKKSKSVDYRHPTKPGSHQRNLVRQVRFSINDQKRISLLQKCSFETSVDEDTLLVHSQSSSGMIREKEKVSFVI